MIAYDGEKTEDDYFRSWKLIIPPARLTLVPVFIKSGGNPLRAVDAAARKKKRMSGFAEFWCVCDCDGASAACIADAKAEAARQGIRLCLSDRCFEIWLALHWGRSEKPILSETDAVELVQEFHPAYSATNKSVPFALLYPRTEQAISNGQWLNSRGHNNPSTSVHSIVRKLKQNTV